MKNTISLLLFVLAFTCCKAQTIIPFENWNTFVNGDDYPEDGDLGEYYLKDVNNLRDHFVGTWSGTQNNKTFKFVITKTTLQDPTDDEAPRKDYLLLRFEIKDSNNNIIESTLSLPDDNDLVSLGIRYNEYKTYIFTYSSEESSCGRDGLIYAMAGFPSGVMKVFLQPSTEMIMEQDCPNGYAGQILPTESVELTRQ